MCNHVNHAVCIRLDLAASMFLSSHLSADETSDLISLDSEDILDKGEDVGMERIDFSKWEEHALEHTEWDHVRSSATPDDWESTTHMDRIPEESDHEDGSPLHFG